MNSIYNGIWDIGETGFTGSSWMGKDRYIAESRTLFSIPEWVPIIRYRSYGFRHHVSKSNEYNLDQVRKLMEYFKIGERYHSDDVSLKSDISWISMDDIEAINDNELPYPYTFKIVSAHNQNGDYIGSLKDAMYLMEKGIYNPELSNDGNKVCSIGYSETDGKWHGWSHRAICGFTIGSTVKKGDCAYVPSDEEDFMEDCIRFWSDDHYRDVTATMEYQEREVEEYGPDTQSSLAEDENVKVENDKPEARKPTGSHIEKEYGCRVSWTYDDTTPNKKIRNKINSVFMVVPDTWGKGEWTAHSMDDAKQMAIDFANGVS